MNATVGARAGAEQRDRDRQHAHDGQAQQRIQGDLPAEVFERRTEQQGAEHQERDGPASTPIATTTIAGVRIVPDSRHEIEAKNSSARPIVASSAPMSYAPRSAASAFSIVGRTGMIRGSWTSHLSRSRSTGHRPDRLKSAGACRRGINRSGRCASLTADDDRGARRRGRAVFPDLHSEVPR